MALNAGKIHLLVSVTGEETIKDHKLGFERVVRFALCRRSRALHSNNFGAYPLIYHYWYATGHGPGCFLKSRLIRKQVARKEATKGKSVIWPKLFGISGILDALST